MSYMSTWHDCYLRNFNDRKTLYEEIIACVDFLLL